MQHLRDVAVAVRDLILQLAGGQVVEIHLAPVVALAEPQNLVRLRQVLPVDLAVAALEELRRRLGHHLAHIAVRGIGHAQPLLLVIARGGDKGEMLVVVAPLHVSQVFVASQLTSSHRVERC